MFSYFIQLKTGNFLYFLAVHYFIYMTMACFGPENATGFKAQVFENNTTYRNYKNTNVWNVTVFTIFLIK